MTRAMQPVRLVFPVQTLRRSAIVQWLLGQGPWRHQAIGFAVLLLALGALATTAWHALDLHRALRIERTAQAARSAAMQAATRSVASTPSRAQAAAWNQALHALNLPWPALLDTLEQHTPSEVALVAIESDPARGRIRLQVEGRTLDGLLAYAAALRSVAPLDEVTVLRHETRARESMQPIRLTLDISLARASSGGLR